LSLLAPPLDRRAGDTEPAGSDVDRQPVDEAVVGV